MRVSYFEIYNEEIRDLLIKNSAKLEVKERPDVGVFVKDLSTYIVNNADDMDRIMSLGNKNSKLFIYLYNEGKTKTFMIIFFFKFTINSYYLILM